MIPSSTPTVRAWKAANPERAAILSEKHVARRRARKMGVVGEHTRAEWDAIKARQRGLCAACGDEAKLTKDHVVPLSMGGSDYAWNLQGLCQPCNSRKGGRVAPGTQLGVFDLISVKG